MISATHQPRLLRTVDSAAWNGTLDVLAVQSDDGATTVLRVVNVLPVPAAANMTVYGLPCAGPASVAAVELYDSSGAGLAAVNPPAQPDLVSPQAGANVAFEVASASFVYMFRPFSFTTLTIQCDDK